MAAFETVCQIWENEYIPTLRGWGFKVTEVPRELSPYLLGEKCWIIERGEKTKATIVIYAFGWEKRSVHINFAPVRSWDFYENAAIGAQGAFSEVVERLVVSATIQRHVRYKPYFVRKMGGKEVRFQFAFKINEWRWLAWALENQKWEDKPYELTGAPETDPIVIFPQFERAVWFDLLV